MQTCRQLITIQYMIVIFLFRGWKMEVKLGGKNFTFTSNKFAVTICEAQ